MKLDNGPLNVLVPAYDASEYIKECIDSIYDQTWLKKGNILNVFVCVDGCDDTKKEVERIINKYRNLEAYYCKENKGTYIALNTMLSMVNSGNIIVFGADDKMHPDMIEKIINTGLVSVVRHDGVLVAPVSLIKDLGGFMPWRCAGDSEILDRIRKLGVNVHRHNELFFRRTHGKQVTQSNKYGYNSEIRSEYRKIINTDRPLKITPEINKFEKIEKKLVSANFATFPKREKYFKKTIEDVVKKVDIVRVCLNEYKEIPKWLKNLNVENVEAVIPEKDQKDKGKFLWSKSKRNEFYFSCDDDLIYSDEYFKNHINFIIENNVEIVTIHGRNLNYLAKNIKECKEYFSCLKRFDRDIVVDVGGTGVMAIDLNKFTVDIDNIDCCGMTDLGLALIAKKSNTKITLRKHSEDELFYILDEKEPTLWSSNLDQTKILKDLGFYPKTTIKSYVLNMKEDKKRLSFFMEQEKKLGICSEVIEPESISGKAVRSIIDSIGKKISITNAKEISNRMTFANILKKATDKMIIIFEDDAEIMTNAYEVLQSALIDLPKNFGVCYLGCYIQSQGSVKKVGKNLYKLNKNEKHRIWGAHAIIFNKIIYKELSEKLSSVDSEITDVEISKSIVTKYDSYIVYPMIAFQEKSGKINSENGSMHGGIDISAFEKDSIKCFEQMIKRGEK